jgi:hypothetical protein
MVGLALGRAGDVIGLAGGGKGAGEQARGGLATEEGFVGESASADGEKILDGLWMVVTARD